jgi:hypothetical protein
VKNVVEEIITQLRIKKQQLKKLRSKSTADFVENILITKKQNYKNGLRLRSQAFYTG